jgi:two-component system sensor histidine kinase BaeS
MRSFNTMAIRLEEEDARRRRLLNDLGHELRTPLSVLRGEIEAMRDGVHRPSPAGFESMLDDVATMERLLADLRTLALTEAGRLELHPETTDLATLVTDAVSSFALLAEDHGVSIRVLTPQPVDEIDIDPVRIRQVVSNLIDNALRHLPEGGAVTVAVRPGPGTVVVTVSDDGPGIPADLLDSIFDRFTKGADSSGSGLGLSIARDLVEAHGGSVTAVNRERGAMFTVTLPAG